MSALNETMEFKASALLAQCLRQSNSRSLSAKYFRAAQYFKSDYQRDNLYMFRANFLFLSIRFLV